MGFQSPGSHLFPITSYHVHVQKVLGLQSMYSFPTHNSRANLGEGTSIAIMETAVTQALGVWVVEKQILG